MRGGIETATNAVATGGVIVYPTDTLWGLGASIRDEAAVRRVFALKHRPLAEPLSIAVARVTDLARLARMTPAAERLLPLLPGPLTLILERTDQVPDVVTGGRSDVGLRVPAHADCLALLSRVGPLTSTSANLHGQREPGTLKEVRSTFGNHVDFYLDTHAPPIGAASTIVDVRSDSVRIVRPGVIRESRIRELLRD